MTALPLDKTVKSSLLDISQIDPKKANMKASIDAEQRVQKQKADFLMMLTTQMKNQDPTNPMDTNTMAQQIFAINQVEQQLETNKHLREIKEYFAASRINNNAGYIGKIAFFEGNSIVVEDSDIKNEFPYELSKGAEKAEITISNKSGATVYRGPLPTQDGKQAFEWIPGDKNPKGIYKFDITAKDASGQSLPVKQWGFGRIQSVFTEGENSSLEVNGDNIPLSKIIKVGL
ncbi:MAG: flagellar hook assembly protein FlgD [Rickettsiales bacterium]